MKPKQRKKRIEKKVKPTTEEPGEKNKNDKEELEKTDGPRGIQQEKTR